MRAARVRLFGAARAETATGPLAFVPDKRYRLLAFLAYRGGWVGRDELAFLFWPDVPDATARHALRQLLKRVRALPWLRGFGELASDARRVRWSVATDVADFHRALAGQDWQGVVDAHAGPLLAGMEQGASAEYADWLEQERAYLEGLWRDGLLAHVEAASAEDEARREVGPLARLLAQDDLDEEVLQAYLRALHRAGRRQAGLRAYRAFAARLQEAWGLEPSAATRQLADALRAGPAAVRTALGTAPAPPTATTSFVGREVELAEIARRLALPECRLLTLTGPGGVGKSRVAEEAAQAARDRFPDGVHRIALEPLTDPAAIPAAIAAVLQLPLRAEEDPLVQVTRRLGAGRALLLLDNMEHLLAGATALVPALLQRCPALKVLVTSRARLGLAEEWLLAIGGLRFPTADLPLEAALALPAMELLRQRAERVAPGFAVGPEELPHALAICRSVGGFPLGIELAAAWTRVVPLADLAQQLENDLDFLASPNANALERHRSLRAVFQHSWQLLSAAEQRTLACLAVFRGGFTREAAERVADAPTAMLAALVDTSLLRMLPNGRYDRHPLILQFTSEALARLPEQRRRSRERHARYFLAFAELVARGSRGAEQRAWFARVDADLDNVRAAFDTFGELGDAAAQLRLAAALGVYWQVRGLYREGLAWLRSSLAHRTERGTSTAPAAPGQAGDRADRAPSRRRPTARTLARAVNVAAGLARALGQVDEARGYYQEILCLSPTTGHAAARADALAGLAAIALSNEADAARALGLCRRSLALYRRLGDADGEAAALMRLANIAREQGDVATVSDALRRAYALYQVTGAPLGMADVLRSLGNSYFNEGELATAADHYQRSLRLYREVGARRGEAVALSGLGLVTARQGRHEEARDLQAASVAIHRALGDQGPLAQALVFLAQEHVALRDVPTARRLLDESLALQQHVGNAWHRADALRALGDLHVAQGQVDAAQASYRESLGLSRGLGDRWGIAHSAVRLARLALDAGRLEEAALSLAEALRLAAAMQLQPVLASALEAVGRLARASGETGWAARVERSAAALRGDAAADAPHPTPGAAALPPSPDPSGSPQAVGAVSLEEVLAALDHRGAKARAAHG